MKKVILITNIPTPYRIPLFNAIDRLFKKNGVEFKVIFAARGYSRRKWKIEFDECRFQHEFLQSRSFQFGRKEATSFSYSRLLRKILMNKPDVVIVSGFSVASMKLWLYSWIFHIPYVIWSGDIQSRSARYSFIRTLQRKLLIKRALGFIAYGTSAKEYLVSLGALPDRIEIGINTVDTNFFGDATSKIIMERPTKQTVKRLLYVGHLTTGKRLDLLFKAIALLKKSRNDFILDVVGDGPEMRNLKKLSEQERIVDAVFFHGFKQKDELLPYFQKADCFLFPSEYDIWGLVLVEAMAAGIPCIASVHAGATRDLIDDGKTGYCVDFSSVDSVVEILVRLLDDDVLRKNIAKNAMLQIQRKATIQHSALGFLKIVEKVVSR